MNSADEADQAAGAPAESGTHLHAAGAGKYGGCTESAMYYRDLIPARFACFLLKKRIQASEYTKRCSEALTSLRCPSFTVPFLY